MKTKNHPATYRGYFRSRDGIPGVNLYEHWQGLALYYEDLANELEDVNEDMFNYYELLSFQAYKLSVMNRNVVSLF